MAKQHFYVDFEGTALIELDDAVIAAVKLDPPFPISGLEGDTDEETTKNIVVYIARNIVVNNLRLSQIDGWADQPDSNARELSQIDWEIEVSRPRAKIV